MLDGHLVRDCHVRPRHMLHTKILLVRSRHEARFQIFSGYLLADDSLSKKKYHKENACFQPVFYKQRKNSNTSQHQLFPYSLS